MRQYILRYFILFIITATLSIQGKAATYNWTGTTSSAWNVATNWSPNGIPGSAAGDIVQFGVVSFTGSQPTLSTSLANSIASITFGALTNTTLTITGVTLTVTGAVTLNHAAGASTACTITGTGTLTCANVLVGNNADPTPTGARTVIFTSTVSQFNISGNLSLYAWMGTNGTRTTSPTFNLGTGTLNVDGQIIGTNENGTSNTCAFSNATGSQNSILMLMHATPFPAPSLGTFTRTLNGTSTTVNYDLTGAQTVFPTTYTNLTFSGSGAKNMATTATINGTMSMQGTATAGTTAITYGANATLEYKGTASQTASAIEFPATSGPKNLIINNSAGVVFPASFQRTISTGTVTLTAGTLTTSTNSELIISNTNTAAITGGSVTAYINGPLRWTLAPGSTYSFPVGKGGTYYPFGITGIAGTSPVITVEAFNTNPGGTADPVTLVSKSTTEYWSASITSGTISTANISLTRQAALGTLNAIARSSTQAGTYSSLNGTVSGTSVNNSDNVGAALGFFQLAEKITNPTILTISDPTTAVTTANICQGATSVKIHAFKISTNGVTGTGTLTNFQFTTTGTYVAAEIANFKIWYNTVDNFSTATWIATRTPGVGPSTINFPAFTLNIPYSTTYYFWITMDVSASVTDGKTITVNSSSSTDMTTTLTKAGGPVNSSGTQTLKTPPTAVSVSGGGTVCGSTTLTATGGTGGTIYWQNITSGGTSTATPSTSQLVSVNGTYYFRAQNAAGCWGSEGSATVTINALPTITLGTDPTVCQSITSANLTYSAVTGSPAQYSINYDATAEAQGFVDITNAALPASPIVLTVPAGANAGTYSYSLTVKNTTTGCVSNAYAKNITITSAPAITLGSNTSVCRGTTSSSLSYSATTGSPDLYSVNYDATAEAQGFADVAYTALPVSPINLTVPAGANPGTYNYTILVKNNGTGCISTSYAKTITVNAIPTITLGSDPSIGVGTTSANLTYSATSGSPDKYSINYDATAEAQGFVDVTDAVLTASPIVLTVPGGAAEGTYNYVVTVKNSSNSCTSSNYNKTIVLTNYPTITLGAISSICKGTTTAELSYSATTGAPDQYSVNYDATAEAQGFADVVNSALPASPITLSVPAGANAATYNAILTVRNSGTGFSSINYNISVTLVAPPTTAVAGTDQNISTSTTTLAGNTPTIGTGNWTLFSGTGSVTTPSSPTSGVTGMSEGTNIFRWTISNNPCPASFDDVSIIVNFPPTITLGSISSICKGTTTAELPYSATTKSPDQYSVNYDATAEAQGFVDVVNGALPVSPITLIVPAGVNAATYNAILTVRNSSTGLSSINYNISIIVVGQPTTATAGPDQSISVSYATMAANTPAIGTGTWTKITGNGTITSANSPTTTITGLGGGINTYRWTISNSPCPNSSDDISIDVTPLEPTITLGANPTICYGTTSTSLSYSATTNSPNQYSIDFDATANSKGFIDVTNAVLPASPITITTPGSAIGGLYNAILTVRNTTTGFTSINYPITVTISNPPTTANAGASSSFCATATKTLAANNPATGTGIWSFVSGPSTLISQISNVNQRNAVFTPAGGAGIYVLRWTISNPPCNASTSDVTYTVAAPPTTAVAGPGQTVYTSTTTMAANTPTTGTGSWSVLFGGTAVVTTPSSPTSGVTGLSVGSNTLRWTISNTGCTSSNSNVNIVRAGAPATPGPISGTVNAYAGSTGKIYSIGTVQYATSFNWTIPTGWTITAGAGTRSITVTVGSEGQNGNISVTASNPAGTSAASILAVTSIFNPPHADCQQCHIGSHSGLAITPITGNTNLCISCHNPTGNASDKPFTDAMKATPGVGGKSHRWDVAAVNATLETNTPSNADMAGMMNGANIICSTCHNQHGPFIANFLRISNTGDAMCKDCHSARNVGTYASSSTNKGSHPVGVNYPAADPDFNASPSNPKILTPGSKVECSSCHGIHDNQAVAIPLTNDGYLLRATNDNNLCKSCHTYTTHQGNDCNTCHKTHNTNKSNIMMIANSILGNTVNFTAKTGANSFCDGNVTYDGVCEACHSSKTYFTNTNKAVPGSAGTSHAWDVNAVSATYETNTPSNTGMAARIYSSKIVCVTCHNQHSDAIPNALRMSNTADAMCKDCHSARDVGTWGASASNKGSHPVGVTYPNSDPDYNASPTNPKILIVNSKVECTSCHGVHDVTGTLGLTNDGNLLRVTNNDALCTNCHKYTAHQTFGCSACHDVHNTSKTNILMVRSVVQGRTVVFTAESGTNSFADANATYDGICEVCHTVTSYHRQNGGGSSHNNASNCTGCHLHSNAFAAPASSSCIDCHSMVQGTRPQITGAGGEFSKASKHVGGSPTDTDCSNCHFEDGALHGNTTMELKNVDLNNQWTGDMDVYCVKCHDGAPPAGVTFPGNDPIYNKAVFIGNKHDYATNSCQKCHNNHGSDNPDLLAVAGNFNGCYQCHKSGGDASTMIINLSDKAIPYSSGKSHAWDVNANSGLYESNYPSNSAMQARVSSGNIVCSTCHQPHDNSIAKFLVTTNAADVMCKNCHTARNIGTYAANVANKGSHPVGVAYPATSEYNAGHALPLVSSKVECMSCHGVHNTATTDGHLLRMTNNINLCKDCHLIGATQGTPVGTHMGMTCKDCHMTHNPDKNNIYMIKSTVATPNSGNKSVLYTGLTGSKSFSDGDGTYDGICEVCHTTTAYHKNTNDGTTHYDGQNCTASCHPHDKNFAKPVCHGCHDATLPYLYPLTSEGYQQGAHAKHVGPPYNFKCNTCHFNQGQGGSGEASHPSGGTGEVVFNPNGLARRNGLDANTPTFNTSTKVCTNVYCHSNGRSAYRGTDGTYTWSNTVGSQAATYATTPSWYSAGSITACTPCHVGSTGNMTSPYTISRAWVAQAAPATGAHGTSAHNSNTQDFSKTPYLTPYWASVQCFWCHDPDGTTINNAKYQGTYGTSFHIDGQTYFKPINFANGGTMANGMSYSANGSVAHCGAGKKCW